jgi:GNAT superfamily N-acetyltransferase
MSRHRRGVYGVAADVNTPTPTFVPLDPARVDSFLGFVEAYYAFDAIPFDRTAIRNAALELLAHPSLGRAWLIEHEGHPVGHVVLSFGFDLEFGGRQATITELFLAPASRSRGLGRATLHFIENVLRGHGIGALELQVERDNVEARAFYEHVGFEASARLPLSKRVAR